MNHSRNQIKTLLREPFAFAQHASGLRLRKYQQGVMEAVFDSVLNDRGYSFVVMFPRQSGKNELQAHLEAYLLTLFSQYSVEIIKISPTLDPQGMICMRRLERVMRKNILTKSMWKKENGNSYKMGGARMTFLSAAAGSNIVGATASGLLEVDEAQQVSIQKFDRDVSPMAASTCATHVFWGTAWTSTTLLGRELRAAQAAEKADGVRRVFRLTAEDIYAEVPSYRKHVADKIARQGRNHPLVRTQYFSEEVDGTGGMFPPDRIAKMSVAAGVDSKPTHNSMTALLLDVAGEDEGVRSMTGDVSLANPSRDATALTLVEIVMERDEDLVGLPLQSNIGLNQQPKANNTFDQSERPTLRVVEDEDLKSSEREMPLSIYRTSPTGLPMYRLVRRWQWIGVKHTELHTLIRDIAMEWKARAVVVDATGVGAGLASFLDRALPGKVTPFNFNRTSKSQLGWDFLAIVDSFRWQEPIFEDLPGDDQPRYQKEFFAQLAACQFEVSNDAKHTMKWSVPEGSRDVVSGELLHDDWVLSAALCAVFEKMDWSLPSSPLLIQGVDPLEEMEGKY